MESQQRVAGVTLELVGVSRRFTSAGGSAAGLHDTHLRIEAGEFVAVIGSSGSGKSTLLNLLGCLDRPGGGRYLIDGQDASQLDAAALAHWRTRCFGFVFQAYHLLPGLSLLDNVALPGLYADRPAAEARQEATRLLEQLGLGGRLQDRPDALSGGQKQRVAIARALLNGAPVLLADEPTGALDSRSAAQVMQLLRQVHVRGRTVVLVTHDPSVAAQADRVIELRDGVVVADRPRTPLPGTGLRAAAVAVAVAPLPVARSFAHHGQTLAIALAALRVHRLRTLLTALGIAIGVASVLCMVTFSQGLRDELMDNLRGRTPNHLTIVPNFDLTQPDWQFRTLDLDDAQTVRGVSGVGAAAVTVGFPSRARLRDRALPALDALGVQPDYFRILDLTPEAGRTFEEADDSDMRRVAVVDETVARQVGVPARRLVGEVLLLETLPLEIVGVVPRRTNNVATVYLPHKTMMRRLREQHTVQSIEVQMDAGRDVEQVEAALRARLAQRKRPDTIGIWNNEKERRRLERNAALLNLLILTIATITLVVAGIGVMNIMLVSVAERAREIGIRMALGARPADIREQFFFESTLICFGGALAGLLLAQGVNLALQTLVAGRRFHLDAAGMVLAFALTLACGMAFGVLPALRAARTVPARTLLRE